MSTATYILLFHQWGRCQIHGWGILKPGRRKSNLIWLNERWADCWIVKSPRGQKRPCWKVGKRDSIQSEGQERWIFMRYSSVAVGAKTHRLEMLQKIKTKILHEAHEGRIESICRSQFCKSSYITSPMPSHPQSLSSYCTSHNSHHGSVHRIHFCAAKWGIIIIHG